MSVVSILKEFGKELVVDTQKSYTAKQKAKSAKYGRTYNENSTLEDSIKFTIREENGAVVFNLKMADYWDYVNKGRRAGPVSQEGQKKIQNWIKAKNINPVKIIHEMTKSKKKPTFQSASKQLAFLIARKKKTKDTKGTKFYDEVINDGRLEELKTRLQEEIKKDIIIEFN